LFPFGLSLPTRFRVRGQVGKWALREVARRRLPRAVADKRKWGFSVPVDRLAGRALRRRWQERLTDRSSRLADYLWPTAVRPLVDAFANGTSAPGVSRAGTYTRALMLLALDLHLEAAKAPRV